MEQDFEYTPVEAMLAERAYQQKSPISGGFELTPYCNLSCKMCYVKETAPGLPLLSGAQWLDIGRQAAQAGVTFVTLTGGEPMLHPDFRMIYSGLRKMGFVISINTNGTMIDEDMADFLAADMPRYVNISLYGSDREHYQNVCGVADAFDRTIRAIELLQARNVLVRINVTPNTLNYRDMKEILLLSRKYKLPSQLTPYLFEPIRKSTGEKQQYRLSPVQTADVRFLTDALSTDREKMLGRRAMCYEMLECFPQSSAITDVEGIQCKAGQCSFWVCWDGAMNICVLINQPHADVLSLGFAGAWEKARAYSDSIRVPARCGECSLREICKPCAAVSLHETGDFSQIPQTLCQSAQIYARMMANGIRREKKPETENERNAP